MTPTSHGNILSSRITQALSNTAFCCPAIARKNTAAEQYQISNKL